MRGHMKKCIRKAAAAVLSAALLVTSESPAFAQNIQQTAVPADVITEQSRLEDGIAQTGYISDSFSEKRQEVQKEDTEGLLKSAAEQLPGQYRTQQLPAVRNQGGYGTCAESLGIFNDCMHGNQSDEKRLRGNGFVGIATDLFCNAFCEG